MCIPRSFITYLISLLPSVIFVTIITMYRQLIEKPEIRRLGVNWKPGSVALPLFESKVPAGFPSPADDHVVERLDTNEYLIDQVDTTFFVTIQGDSMVEVGLMPGDQAVVDKGKSPMPGDIVLAMIDGEFTVKTLAIHKSGKPQLLPANSSGKHMPILIQESMHFQVWGVVIGSFRRFR
jgi:DNA polymerase V